MAARAACVLTLALAVAAVAAQQCSQLAAHYSVLATQDGPGPWAAELSVRRHAQSAREPVHFGVRPAATAHAHKVTVTLAGQLPLERASRDEDDGYEEGEHGGWYKVHRERVTWREALDACAAEGAHLAVVESPQEAADVSALLARHAPHASRELHAGFYALDYEGSFVTEQGQPLSATGYEGWGPGQPDMSICGRVDQQGLLRDGMCDWVEPASFLCERPPWRGPGVAASPPPPPALPPPPPVATPAAGAAPEGYAPVAPHGGARSAYKLHVRPATWWVAAATCAAEGARLAVLNAEAESYVVRELVRRAQAEGEGEGEGVHVLPYVYVGVSARLYFVDVLGRPLSEARYDLWATGYPAFKNCVAVNHNGTLWVTQCWAKYPFLCEYDSS
ncbi:hypothetical protein R5R35_007485 [Gryllus longicercus]|uniref:C-type lectin domain-containing protein n=1 Tax=Gryllus longicercus TaxID=2509291 RepID=A0AAN9Z9Y5_9ORTH